MSRISGVTNELLEDFFDGLDVEARRNDETIPWNEVKKKLDKKHK